MLISYIGGPLHGRVDERVDMTSEADVISWAKPPGYRYKGSVVGNGEVVEVTFVHTFVTQADYDSLELAMATRRRPQ